MTQATAKPFSSPHIDRSFKESGPAGVPKRAATHAHFHRSPAQVNEPGGGKTWLTRGANFVVAISEVGPGTVLARANNPDEYMLLLSPGVGAVIEAGVDRVESAGDSLTILPPGASSMRATSTGLVTRVFSNLATDLVQQAPNAAVYADGAPEIAPILPWPNPVGGFKLRHYRMEDYLQPKNFGRLFRSTNLMINVFEPTTTVRDRSKLSPHSHTDFEQGSLSLSGTVIHHLRTPWTSDGNTWQDDEHAEFTAPALLVIPANLIHTTQYIGGGPNVFVDIFAPPRVDFSDKPGWVRNASDYPMPAKA
jgi:hypothetical protein